MDKLKEALFQATMESHTNMKQLHKESKYATEEEKQFAVGRFSALYGFILENQLYEEYDEWLKTDG